MLPAEDSILVSNLSSAVQHGHNGVSQPCYSMAELKSNNKDDKKEDKEERREEVEEKQAQSAQKLPLWLFKKR